MQHALLKIMEGAPVRLAAASPSIPPTFYSFARGPSSAWRDHAASLTYGYISSSENEQSEAILDRLNSRVKPTDLFKFGLIPEFAGRLPIIAQSAEPVQRVAGCKFMVEPPRDSIYNQFREIFRDQRASS